MRARRSQVGWVFSFADVFLLLLIMAVVSTDSTMIKAVSELIKAPKVHIELTVQEGKEVLTCHGRQIPIREVTKIVRQAFAQKRKNRVLVVAIIDPEVPYAFIHRVMLAAYAASSSSHRKVIWETAEGQYRSGTRKVLAKN